jgi:uncharacterized alpha-E superfamily protein
VAAFLLLDPIFPRSVRYCLERINETLRIIRGSSVPRPADDLECLIGLTLAKWSFSRIDELVATGLHEAIDSCQSSLNRLHELIEARYFIAPPSTTSSPEQECEPA